MEVARKAAQVFDLLGQLEKIASPVDAFRYSCGTSNGWERRVHGALENVAINLESITDSGFSSGLRSESELLVARVHRENFPPPRAFLASIL